MSQLSNLWLIPKSVSKIFLPWRKNMLSETSKTIPHINLCVSFKSGSLKCRLRNLDVEKALILSKGKPTWNSNIGCGVSFESSWWARFHGNLIFGVDKNSLFRKILRTVLKLRETERTLFGVNCVVKLGSIFIWTYWSISLFKSTVIAF